MVKSDPANFLLGIGCQKGGTTWLYKMLSQHNQVDLGFCKEYHVFDALYIPECQVFYEKRRDMFVKEVQSGDFFSRSCINAKYIDFYRDISNYFDYFHYLGINSSIRLVGDITPSYCGLPEEAFAMIRENLLRRGMRPKVLFLMRGPVERCWSAVRMRRRNRMKRGERVRMDEEQEVMQLSMSAEWEFRTRYDITVSNVERVFDKKEVFLGFYEELFTERCIYDICQFLEIDRISPSLGQHVNASPKTSFLSDEAQRKICEFYRPVYEWAFDTFGLKFIKEIWPSASML